MTTRAPALSRLAGEQPPSWPTAHFCYLCGIFHDPAKPCPPKATP